MRTIMAKRYRTMRQEVVEQSRLRPEPSNFTDLLLKWHKVDLTVTRITVVWLCSSADILMAALRHESYLFMQEVNKFGGLWWCFETPPHYVDSGFSSSIIELNPACCPNAYSSVDLFWCASLIATSSHLAAHKVNIFLLAGNVLNSPRILSNIS